MRGKVMMRGAGMTSKRSSEGNSGDQCQVSYARSQKGCTLNRVEDVGEDEGEGQDDKDKEPAFFQVPRLEFVFQMVWQEQPLAERVAKKDAERAAAKEAKEQEEAQKRAEDAAAAATP